MCVDMTPGADIMAAILAAPDRDESVFLMEPLLIRETSRHRGKLTDMAVELAQKAAGFRRSLPESLLASLVGLVRSMNCYYSNLMREGWQLESLRCLFTANPSAKPLTGSWFVSACCRVPKPCSASMSTRDSWRCPDVHNSCLVIPFAFGATIRKSGCLWCKGNSG